MRPTPRRPFLQAALLAAAGSMPMAAWAGFNFFTSEYTASREELQALVARRFPLQQGYGEIFNVRLSDPRLMLDAQANRTAITAALTITSPLLAPSRVNGELTISSALRYDAAALALRLEQPRADHVVLDGVTGADAQRLQRIGAAVAQELLQGQPLRTFTRDELSFGLKTYEIGDITVLQDGIKVQLR